MNWRDPPADKSKIWINKSMELQILLACDWECQACNAHSNFHGISFVKKGTMSIQQIKHFISEMGDKNAYLGRIRILGGEPTLHPRFEVIVELLFNRLVETGHVGGLEVITHGGPKTVTAIDQVRTCLEKVRVSGQKAKEKHHTANLVHTPHSLGYEGIMCSQPWHCGFSLGYYGYFPCAGGGGVARLQNWMKWQRLELPLPSVRETWPDLQELCNHCFHALREEHKVKCGTDKFELNVPNQEQWGYLAPWVNGKQPDWKVYGATVAKTQNPVVAPG